MSEKLGPAFAVSRVGASTKYGGTTYTLKAHFHTRDHAETVRRLLGEQPLPPGPFPEQFAAQAELIDTGKLAQALAWLGCSAPAGEMLSWWIGREVNHLLDAVLEQRASRGGERSDDAPSSDEPSDTERLRMVLHAFGQREDNMPLTPSERDVLYAFSARGEFTDSMRLRVIDSAIRAARSDGGAADEARNGGEPSAAEGKAAP